MKIGIFAGTFDPIHSGHLAFAVSATQEAQLNKVIIVAEKEPYRKKPHTTWDHRQAMIERATKDIENIDHDYQFAAKLSHQHTMANMLSTAHLHYGLGNEYWFLVGSDIFEHIHKWHDLISEEDYGGFVVALRDDHTREWVFEKCLAAGIDKTRLVVTTNSHPGVSSSKIRHQINTGEPVAVPQAVSDYARLHKLYNS